MLIKKEIENGKWNGNYIVAVEVKIDEKRRKRKIIRGIKGKLNATKILEYLLEEKEF